MRRAGGPLIGRIGGSGGQTFTIDIWGNLTNINVERCSTPILNAPVNEKNQFLGTAYDAAGNLWGNWQYPFDAENRLIGTAGVTYTYDGDGQRVKKSSGSLYWYDLSENVLMETNFSGQELQEFVYFAGRKVSTTDAWSGQPHYYFSDHLGSTNVVTNADGTVIEEESDFYPFGGERVLTHSLWYQHYKFTGKERDGESGLDYFGARYYSSSLGRFLTPDWASAPTAVPYAEFGDPQSLNLYGYVGNNPMAKADADGHCCAPSELADYLDSKVQAFRQDGLSVNSNASPTTTGINTFANGVTGDLAQGFTNLLRTGQSWGSLPSGASTGQKIAAAAEEGGRVGGTILLVVSVGGPKAGPEPAGNTLKPGPYAADGVPASGPRITAAEQRAVNLKGSRCHTCGATDPGTKSGNWVGDHQPATALNPSGAPQTMYPQCLACSRIQGGQVRAAQLAGQAAASATARPLVAPQQKKPGEN